MKWGVKLQCLTEERETTSGYWEVRKNEGLRNQGSTVVILKRRILLGVSNGPIQFESARKIFASACMLGFSLKFPAV